MEIQKLLPMLRMINDWTQEDLAHKAAMSRTTIATIESTGKYNALQIEKIAEAFKLSVEDFWNVEFNYSVHGNKKFVAEPNFSDDNEPLTKSDFRKLKDEFIILRNAVLHSLQTKKKKKKI